MWRRAGRPIALGWRVTARCAFRKRDGMKSIRECTYRAELKDADPDVGPKSPKQRFPTANRVKTTRSAFHVWRINTGLR
jgi:hypothetical protein